MSIMSIIILCIFAMGVCFAFDWIEAFWIATLSLFVAVAVAIWRAPDGSGASLPWQ